MKLFHGKKRLQIMLGVAQGLVYLRLKMYESILTCTSDSSPRPTLSTTIKMILSKPSFDGQLSQTEDSSLSLSFLLTC